eukprot:TRINITY_DN23266_c0_g1_i1.p1 TRINITY_DN23266_c0_g1~~TRINITY_DN23266_c0_g1_i1.p1  ORF type:complete len:391 (+),score=72.59 TRINITY_DN23266_c0_g1_i1:184-1356(+)
MNGVNGMVIEEEREGEEEELPSSKGRLNPNKGFSSKHPVLPESPFRTRLIEEVRRKLQQAVNARDSSSQRQELLRQLFTDLALEVDNRARGLLYGETEPLELPAANGGGKSSLCFYEVLAEHYAQRPEDGDALLPLFSPMWSQPFTSQLFTLLLHQWLFHSPATRADEIQRLSRGFIIGCGDVFWIDMKSNVRRFRPIFRYVVHAVALSPARFARIPAKAGNDLVYLICRFFFFYEPGPVPLAYFLAGLPASVGSPFVGGPADVFVTELANKLLKIKVEPVLVQYLECIQDLKGLELRTTTSIRLQVVLYSMASPGGPLFPTRSVRHKAKAALDHVFPDGRRFRNVINLLFRLLQPAYWIGSLLNYFKSSVKAFQDWLHPRRYRRVVREQ